MSCFKHLLGVAPIALLLFGCGMGEPVTIDDVEAKMSEDFSVDGAEVTWVSAEQTGEDENDFTVFMDVTEGDETSTKRCDVSMTSMSSSYTCRTASPSVPGQVESEIRDQFTQMGGEVQSVDIARDDDGNIAGQATILDPSNGQVITSNCTAAVDELRYEWNCGE